MTMIIDAFTGNANAYHLRNQAAGLCKYCGGPVKTGRLLCARHLKIACADVKRLSKPENVARIAAKYHQRYRELRALGFNSKDARKIAARFKTPIRSLAPPVYED